MSLSSNTGLVALYIYLLFALISYILISVIYCTTITSNPKNINDCHTLSNDRNVFTVSESQEATNFEELKMHNCCKQFQNCLNHLNSTITKFCKTICSRKERPCKCQMYLNGKGRLYNRTQSNCLTTSINDLDGFLDCEHPFVQKLQAYTDISGRVRCSSCFREIALDDELIHLLDIPELNLDYEFFKAIHTSDLDRLTYLIECGANPLSQFKQNIMCCLENGNVTILKLLLLEEQKFTNTLIPLNCLTGYPDSPDENCDSSMSIFAELLFKEKYDSILNFFKAGFKNYNEDQLFRAAYISVRQASLPLLIECVEQGFNITDSKDYLLQLAVEFSEPQIFDALIRKYSANVDSITESNIEWLGRFPDEKIIETLWEFNAAVCHTYYFKNHTEIKKIIANCTQTVLDDLLRLKKYFFY